MTTGISAFDRAHTIRAAVKPDARPEDLVQPGHIFPLMAQPGGVLTRAGHTEAGCDLGAPGRPGADGGDRRDPQRGRHHGAPPGPRKIRARACLAHRHHRRPDPLPAAQRTHHRARGRRPRSPPSTASSSWSPIRTRSTTPCIWRWCAGKSVPPTRRWCACISATRCPTCWASSIARFGWPLRRAWRASPKKAPAWSCCCASRNRRANWCSRFVDLKQTAIPDDQADPQPVLRTYGIGAQILSDLGVRKMRVLSAPKRMQAISGFRPRSRGLRAL